MQSIQQELELSIRRRRKKKREKAIDGMVELHKLFVG
jgi:hypothetical protein